MVPSHRRALRARPLSFRYLFRIGFSSRRFGGGEDKVMAGGTPANPAALASFLCSAGVLGCVYCSGLALSLLQVGGDLVIRQCIGLVRVAGRGCEHDSKHMTFQVAQWTPRVARPDRALDHKDLPRYAVRTVDFVTLRLKNAVNDGGGDGLWTAPRLSDHCGLSATGSAGQAETRRVVGGVQQSDVSLGIEEDDRCVYLATGGCDQTVGARS